MPLSRLQPDSAVLVAGITALGVVAIYTHSVPNLSDVRTAPSHDDTVEKERRTAAIQATVLVLGVSLISRDLTPWILGGAMLVGLDLMVKHSNAINPTSGKYDAEANAAVTALPTYAEAM
jgi:hypothetical protein